MDYQTDVKDAIIREMIVTIKQLGAKSDTLGIVCSYGETLSDCDLLSLLREGNKLELLPKGHGGGVARLAPIYQRIWWKPSTWFKPIRWEKLWEAHYTITSYWENEP